TTAIGRIGNRVGLELLVARLRDRDPNVVADAFFALGLLKDSAAATPIIERLRHSDSLSAPALTEAASALARIGGADAAQALADTVGGRGELGRDRRDAMRGAAILESWRLAAAAPVEAILPFVRDTSLDLRWRSLYALARIGTPRAGEALFSAARDRAPLV